MSTITNINKEDIKLKLKIKNNDDWQDRKLFNIDIQFIYIPTNKKINLDTTPRFTLCERCLEELKKIIQTFPNI